MIEYIKMLIISFISALLKPVAVSSSAHFSFLDKTMNVTESKEESALYFSIITLVFSLVAIFFVRKIYAKGFKAVFSKKNQIKSAKTYKTMMINLLISMVPAVIMFIPISKDKFIADFFVDYLWKSNILVSACCCIGCGLILFVALWYASQKNENKHKNSTKSDVIRFSIYQLPTYFFPGFSGISMASSSLILSKVEETVIMRDVFVYIAPSTLVVSIFRIIRCALSGIVIDPIMIAVCAVAAIAGNVIMFNIVSKINIRKAFLFFSVYSIIMGAFIGVCSFIIH